VPRADPSRAVRGLAPHVQTSCLIPTGIDIEAWLTPVAAFSTAAVGGVRGTEVRDLRRAYRRSRLRGPPTSRNGVSAAGLLGRTSPAVPRLLARCGEWHTMTFAPTSISREFVNRNRLAAVNFTIFGGRSAVAGGSTDSRGAGSSAEFPLTANAVFTTLSEIGHFLGLRRSTRNRPPTDAHSA
jgi:hypothetical protein